MVLSGTALLLLGLLTFALACGLTRCLLSPTSPLAAVDHPNDRSLHDRPTPTGGGIAITLSLFVFGAVLASIAPAPGLPWIGLAAGLVAVISLVDDFKPLPPLLRLSIHVFAAAVLIGGGFSPFIFEIPGFSWLLPGWIGAVFCLLFVVWITNLYNFMDGMDGFAAGMAVIGFSTFAILGLQAGALTFMATSLITAAAAAGFLVFNFPPARIFMGDVGASTIGLLAAALSLWAHRDGLFSLWIGLLVFSPFVVDATVTLCTRVARRQRVWQAHTTHFYQRLVRIGWGHKKTVLWEYLLMLLCSTSAILAVKLTAVGQWLLLSGWAVTYTVLMIIVYRLDTTNRVGP